MSTPNTLSDATIASLVKAASRRAWSDKEDFCAYDYSGGNFDDAFAGGQDAGETYLARDILTELGIPFTTKED